MSASNAPEPESGTSAEHASTEIDSPVGNGLKVSTDPSGVGHNRRPVSCGDDYPSSDRVSGCTKRRFPSGQMDGSEILDEPQRRRSSR